MPLNSSNYDFFFYLSKISFLALGNEKNENLFYCFLVLVWDLLANSLVEKDVMNGRGNPPSSKQGLACKETVFLSLG